MPWGGGAPNYSIKESEQVACYSGATRLLSAMGERRGEYVCLPVVYDSWPALTEDLKSLARKEVQGLHALEQVLAKNDRWGGIHLPLGLLRSVLDGGEVCTREYFSNVQLPWMAKTALAAEQLFRDTNYKLQKLCTGRNSEIMLTRRQACCILCLAFFNAFEPRRGNNQRFTLCEYLSSAMSRSQKSKLLCLLNYFKRIQGSEVAKEEDFLSMRVSVSRRRLDPGGVGEAVWKNCEKPLLPFESLNRGTIESADGCLQVDFANKFIGGGVLRRGSVQEEIRFVINPECLVSTLVCERMNDLESIVITGAEQFSTYAGYGGNFTYTGPYDDANPVDERSRRCVSIVAMDAVSYSRSGPARQFHRQDILRELGKAYSGFTSRVTGDDPCNHTLIPVATGNWGCGAFKGDKPLKTLIQWLAASRAGRTLKYYTFKDSALSRRQVEVTQKLLREKMTVSQLYEILVSDSRPRDMFDYVKSF